MILSTYDVIDEKSVAWHEIQESKPSLLATLLLLLSTQKHRWQEAINSGKTLM
jgi:hypothetical protein